MKYLPAHLFSLSFCFLFYLFDVSYWISVTVAAVDVFVFGSISAFCLVAVNGDGAPLPLVFIISLFLCCSPGQFALEEPLETALLLSLGGVGCIAVNQWHSSFQQNTHNMATVLDSRVWLYIYQYSLLA